jgi:hypothetical protein
MRKIMVTTPPFCPNFVLTCGLGAKPAGKIIADFTPLVRSGKIRLTNPDEGYEGVPHYRIEFELVMIINGRNLRFEARWPKGGEVRGSTQICIAAAFKPGTK